MNSDHTGAPIPADVEGQSKLVTRGRLRRELPAVKRELSLTGLLGYRAMHSWNRTPTASAGKPNIGQCIQRNSKD